MMAPVHGYEGTVNQVMGDGIMALCGVPPAHGVGFASSLPKIMDRAALRGGCMGRFQHLRGVVGTAIIDYTNRRVWRLRVKA
jgi:class 3 adenylate cyclase